MEKIKHNKNTLDRYSTEDNSLIISSRKETIKKNNRV